MDNITAMLWSGCKLLYEVVRYTIKHIKEKKAE